MIFMGKETFTRQFNPEPLFNPDLLSNELRMSIYEVRTLLYPELGREQDSFATFIELYKRLKTPEARETLKFLRAADLVAFATRHAPFYQQKWGRLGPEDIKTPQDLLNLSPVTKEEMQQHTWELIQQRDNNPFISPKTSFMTRSPVEGYSSWNTGGSTVFGTISIRGSKEWQSYVKYGGEEIFSRYFNEGEVVGVLINGASGWSGARVFGEMAIHTPGVGSTSLFMSDGADVVLKNMINHGITSIFGQPEALTHPSTGLIKRLEELDSETREAIMKRWRKFVYGGSPMTKTQILGLTNLGIEVRPIYSQTEAGPIGVSPMSCPFLWDKEGNVLYHPTALNYFVVLKDSEGNPRLIVTNLLYAIAPVVHYENRDMGQWVGESCKQCNEPLFAFKGRVPEDLAIGTLKIKRDWVVGPITALLDGKGYGNFQSQLIRDQEGVFKIRLVIPGIDSSKVNLTQLYEEILNAVRREFLSRGGTEEDFTEFKTLVTALEVSGDPKDIIAHPRTGKILPFVTA
jgi:phenylacetate-coenzyme A ligase PaaK-like adenylate-forming protein